jgi:hypothetical protein
VPDNPSNPGPQSPRPSIVAAGLLLAALALVVLYTSRRAFLSPVALVVVAAIGMAALLLQLRLRPNPSSDPRASNSGSSNSGSSDSGSSLRVPLWFNALGVVFALGAVFADVLHLNTAFMLIAALAAVVSFAVGGIVVLSTLRRRRI